MKQIRAFFSAFYRRYGGWVTCYVLLTVLHKALAFATPQALQKLIDSAVAGQRAVYSRWLLANAVLVIAFIAALYLRSYVKETTEGRASAMAGHRVFQDMLSAPFAEVKKYPLGHYVHFFERDIDRVKGLAFYDLTVLLTNIAMTAAMLIYLFSTDWRLALVVAVIIPLLMIATKGMLPRVERAEEAVIDQAEHINDTVNELYNGNETIRASNAEGFFLERADGVVRRWFDLERKRAKENVLYDILLITGLMNAANILIYCLGGLFVTQGTLTIGVVNTFALYFSSLWNSVEGFLDFAKEYKVKMISLRRLGAFHEKAGAQTDGAELPTLERLEARGLCFAYEGKTVLSDLSLQVRKGEKILITGENGSGKSTLARILCKLLTPSDGSLAYNGIEYAEIDASALRRHVRLIPSEAFVVEGDLRANLFGREAGVAVPAALRGLQAQKNGANLSSGQKKQIQFARCLSADADAYILDEPFQYMDREAAANLWREILSLLEGKTLIVISHDTLPVPDCDRVIRVGEA